MSFTYQVSRQVRNRLFHTIRGVLEDQSNGYLSIETVFHEMYDKILQRYGSFRRSAYRATQASDDPVVEHFFSCTDREFADFVEMCFSTRGNFGKQRMVGAINAVLDEENVGLELTPYSETCTEEATLFGRVFPSAKTVTPELPRAIRRDEKLLQAEVVRPSLKALDDPRFVNARQELLDAFDEYRMGRFRDSVTDAGAAFETLLKTICALKGWSYDEEKDTTANLLAICRNQGLFYSFYAQILAGSATIRNKLGDAHGKGPHPQYTATRELAEHMLYTVCININLLISLAKL